MARRRRRSFIRSFQRPATAPPTRRARVARRASQIVKVVAAAPARAARRVIRSRPVSYLRGRRQISRTSGVSWKSVAKDMLMNSAGGVFSKVTGIAGRVISQQTATAIDDSPVAQSALKGGIGAGIRWVMGSTRSVDQFVAGMNGAIASDLFDLKIVKPIVSFAKK